VLITKNIGFNDDLIYSCMYIYIYIYIYNSGMQQKSKNLSQFEVTFPTGCPLCCNLAISYPLMYILSSYVFSFRFT
jgi:hypothetical protein